MTDSLPVLDRRAVLGGLAATALLGAGPARAEVPPPVPPLIGVDYALARASFRTRLTKRGPAPDDALPLTPPPGAERIGYRSGSLELTAWVSKGADRGPRRPAVLFLHGGDALGFGHWDLVLPYEAAGYVAMIPALRGENGQPGAYSGFYDENADVLAAAARLADLAGVDPERLFLAGHSMGGTQVLLAALSERRFRAAAAFSGSCNAYLFFRRFPEMVCFDTADPREFQMRSPACYATSFKCPVRIFHGSAEARLDAPSRLTAERARAAGLDVRALALKGDHSSALDGEIPASLAFFAA